jgi:protein required for attachment to host cells
MATSEAAKLNIVASPRALGVIRKLYSPAVRDVLKSELGKDYVRLPLAEIEKRLFE